MSISKDFNFWMKVYRASKETEDYPEDLFTIIEMTDQEYIESFDCSISDNDEFRVLDFSSERLFIYVYTIEQYSKIVFYFTIENVFCFRMTVEADEGYSVQYATRKSLSADNAYVIGNFLYNINGPITESKFMAGVDDQYDRELTPEYLMILKMVI